MPFSFHPPTRTFCSTCEKLTRQRAGEMGVVSAQRGKSSSADNFPVHNWFNFVLGYSPEFPHFMLDKFGLTSESVVLDPFTGSGTTQVAARSRGISTIGVEANDYFHFAASTKLLWTPKTRDLQIALEHITTRYRRRRPTIIWGDARYDVKGRGKQKLSKFLADNRPAMLDPRYMSDAALGQFLLIRKIFETYSWPSRSVRQVFEFALSAILVPCSNIRYGPGFGISKKAREVDVLNVFREKVLRIAEDLRQPEIMSNRKVGSRVILGDARSLSSIIEQNSIDAMITSPPYPGDHEYTKHSRIELIWCEMANSKSEFQMIKKRMLRGSTTNVYREDSLGELVRSISSIRAVTDEIDVRLKTDGATSGFEKLYTKLIWEYFGGMYLVFREAKKVLKPGAPFSLLVSDSHAFKMVHIATGDLLSEVAKLAGFTSFEQDVWQLKKTTSHGYSLAESILTVR